MKNYISINNTDIWKDDCIRDDLDIFNDKSYVCTYNALNTSSTVETLLFE